MRLIRVTAVIGLTLMALGAAAAPARASHTEPNVISISGCECVGDDLNGVLHVAGDAGDRVELLLYAKDNEGSDWAPTGRSQTFTMPANSNGNTGHRFTFSLAGLGDNHSYVVEAVASGHSNWSNVVLSTTCAPGEEIPEAPVALLLPVSLLGTMAVGGLMLRRRQAATLAR
jgi:hypothetical protein